MPRSNTTKITVPKKFRSQIEQLLELLMLEQENSAMDMDMDTEPDQKVVDLTEEEEEVVDPIAYEVEKVLSCTRTCTGDWQFLIKWKGWPASYNEYIPDSDTSCEKLIRQTMDEQYPEVPTVYLFCRVSSKNQDANHGASLETQMEALKKYASIAYAGLNVRIKPLQVVESAYNRAPFREFVAEHARKGDTILAYRHDRFSRNIDDIAVFVELNQRGVKIGALEENQPVWYRDGPAKFCRKIIEAMEESDKISSRIKSALDWRKKRGDDAIGGLPYGFRYRRETEQRNVLINGEPTTVVATKKLHVEVDPKAEETITKLFELLETYRNKNQYEQTAKKLNSLKMFKKNRPWTVSMIHSIATTYTPDWRETKWVKPTVPSLYEQLNIPPDEEDKQATPRSNLGIRSDYSSSDSRKRYREPDQESVASDVLTLSDQDSDDEPDILPKQNSKRRKG